MTPYNLILNKYIQSLVSNVNKKNIPDEIDLCFDGGAFNGIFSLGIAQYIKKLEENKITTVKRISGVSIGAFIGIIYILNNSNINHDTFFELMSVGFKNNLNLYHHKNIVNKFIYEYFLDDDMTILNNKLYISYYDLKYKKHTTISKYKNRKHLIECLLRSSFIPYLMNGKSKYKNRYIDGIYPYFFNDNDKNGSQLFIKLITCDKVFRSVKINMEQNAQSRILDGIIDANIFFTYGKSDMCHYVNNDPLYYKLEYFIRTNTVLLFLKIIEITIICYSYVPLCLKYKFYNKKIYDKMFELFIVLIETYLFY